MHVGHARRVAELVGLRGPSGDCVVRIGGFEVRGGIVWSVSKSRPMGRLLLTDVSRARVRRRAREPALLGRFAHAHEDDYEDEDDHDYEGVRHDSHFFNARKPEEDRSLASDVCKRPHPSLRSVHV